MNFKPKNEQELQKDNERLLLAARKEPYPATVIEATDKVSKKGNEMIEIKLNVFADDGSHRVVTDYLMEAMMHKLLHFAEATGQREAYDKGTLCAYDCEGKNLFVKIGIDPASGDFAAKNVIKDYISAGSELRHESRKNAALPRPAADPDLDANGDDIPFVFPFAPFIAGLGTLATLCA